MSERFRFPGLNAFTLEDSKVFEGRENDSIKLRDKILLYNTIVLHADSGTGKSSLIQAGLLPLLWKQEEKCYPVLVSLSEVFQSTEDNVLVNYTLNMLKNEYSKMDPQGLPFLDEQEDSFWKYSKQLEKAGYKLLLVFDQFENLQTYNNKQICLFIKQLFNLVNHKIPAEVYSNIEKAFASATNEEATSFDLINKAYLFLNQPSTAKILFVIREDKLGVMSLLASDFPDILKNDFTIKDLTKEGAYNAICKPAMCEGDFVSPQFFFEDKNVVETLISKISDPETNLVSPIQLQIVASDLERNAVLEKGKTILSANEIPDLKDIISRFYHLCWEDVRKKLNYTSRDLFEIKKEVIPLLLAGERRDLVSFVRFKEKGVEKVANELVMLGFLRKIPFENHMFHYQLSHDRLIEPASTDLIRIKAEEKAKETEQRKIKRVEEEKKKAFEENQRLLAKEEIRMRELENLELRQELIQSKNKSLERWLLRTILCVLLGILLYAKVAGYFGEFEKFKGTFNKLKDEKPTLAFRVLREFESSNKVLKILSKNELDSLERYLSKYGKQTGLFPIEAPILSVSVNKNDDLIIEDSKVVKYWEKSRLWLKELKPSSLSYLKKKKIKSDVKTFYIHFKAIPGSRIRVYKDSLDLGEISYDPKNKDVLSLNDPSGTDIIDVSADGKLVVLGENIFALEKKLRRVSWFPEKVKQDRHQLLSVIFLGDKYIAVGYSNGRIFIYKVRENSSAELYGTLELQKHDSNRTFVKLPLCTYDNGRCLIAGVGKQIMIWDLRKDSIAKNNHVRIWERVKMAGKINPDIVIDGHDDIINSLSLTADEKEVISGSQDKTTKIWNLKNYNLSGIFKEADESIESTGFVENSDRFYSVTSSGRLYLWALGNNSSELKTGEIIHSPFLFEAEAAGIKDYLPVKYYDTSSTKEYYISILNYIMSLPVESRTLEVAEYKFAWEKSLQDIDKLIPRLINRKDFFKVVNKSQRQLLYNEYYKIEKLRKDRIIGDRKRLKLYSKFVKELQQENDILIAIDLINKQENLLNTPLNPVVYLDEDIERYKTLESALHQATKQFPDSKETKKVLEKCLIDLSYLYILDGNEHEASTCLNQVKGHEIKEERDFLRVRFLLYSLKGELDQASAMYRKLKKRDPYQYKTQSYKDIFKVDLQNVEKQYINKGNTILADRMNRANSEILDKND